MRYDVHTGYFESNEQARDRIARRDWQYACQMEIGYRVDEQDAEYLARLVDHCNTDPAHILNAQTEADWLQADNAAAQYMEGTTPSPFVWGGEVYDPNPIGGDDEIPF